MLSYGMIGNRDISYHRSSTLYDVILSIYRLASSVLRGREFAIHFFHNNDDKK